MRADHPHRHVLTPALLALLVTLAPAAALGQPEPAEDGAPAGEPATEPEPAAEPGAQPAVEPEPDIEREPVHEMRATVAGLEMSSTSSSARSAAQSWLIMPRGTEVGAAFRFLTSDVGLGQGELKLTDVVFLRLHGRRSIKGRGEVFGGLDILPKQPSYTDEDVWQSAHAGGRLGIGRRLAASLQVEGGPLLVDSGYWGAAGASLLGRHRVDEILDFQGALGGSFTQLFLDGAGDAGSPWVAEISAAGEVLFHDPHGNVGAWFGIGFAFPVAGGGALPGAGDYDPETRVNVRVGGVVALVEIWDLFVEYAVIDRGDATDAATMLPVLDGGFDQHQLIVGLTRRLGTTEPPNWVMIQH